MNTRLACALLLAAGTVTGARAADLEQGRAQSLACQACHGSAGIGVSADIPNLAGQKTAYIQAQLTAFRARERKHDLMNAIAAQLADADIANLAAFWNSMPAAGVTMPDPAAQFRKSRMTFPQGFPGDFVMYREDADAQNKSLKRSYANRAAVRAARAGQPLPAGSVIVVANYAARPGDKAGSWLADQVTSYAAMESRAGWGAGIPDLLRNGDWSYALFDASKNLRAEFNYARCLACHKPKADSSYVFGLTDIAATK